MERWSSTSRFYSALRTGARDSDGRARTPRTGVLGPSPEPAAGGECRRMLLIALRDLQWRRRRFIIAVLATSLRFALTLLLSGPATGLRGEASRAVRSFDAGAWFVPEGTSGPFTASSLLPE